MRFIQTIVAKSRQAMLARQLGEIDKILASMTTQTRSRLAALVLRQIDEAEQCQFPHLYGTDPSLRYKMWGTGTELGMQRAKSDNLQVRMRGVALWLAVAYHETRAASTQSQSNVARRIQGTVRELRELASTKSARGKRVA